MSVDFSHKTAKELARANAKWFDHPYVVFCDANGKWRTSAYCSSSQLCYGIVFPDGSERLSKVEVEAKTLMPAQAIKEPA